MLHTSYVYEGVGLVAEGWEMYVYQLFIWKDNIQNIKFESIAMGTFVFFIEDSFGFVHFS